MATYVPADKKVHDFVDDVMRQYHPDLHSKDVHVDVGFLVPALDKNGDKVGDPIKCGGCPVAATIRINNQMQRARGWAGVSLLLDKDRWDEFTEENRTALVDQQLTRLEIVKENKGKDAKWCDDGALALRMRQFDIVIRGFEEVILRHAKSSIEAMALQEVVIPEHRAFKQKVFNFDHADELEMAEAA